MIGIGIDTGGTYTDAVLFDTETGAVLDRGKARTTHDRLQAGISQALDQMDAQKVHQAQMIALSTTLATNAALENVGSRAKCLLIGMNKDYLKDAEKTYSAYGLNDFDQLVFMDGKPEYVYRNPEEPDWDMLRENAANWFEGCKSIGVTQIMAYADGGKLENRARKVLEEMGYQVTTSHDMFHEAEVLKCAAATLLNAGLIPIITEFILSVQAVLKERELQVPIAIVRSDGALMSRAMAKHSPVETLLSGPAASSVGGRVLSGEADALIVDMGGTTTDVALIRKGRPLWAEHGIRIGRWDTAVRGLYIDTFLLGGDSAVRFEKEELFLDGKRVIPLCILASRYPSVTWKLKELSENSRMHTRMLHEFMVLQKMPERIEDYTEKEQRIILALKQEPLMLTELAEQVQDQIYTMNTDRLEKEGILIRSGLTPTDMMIVKGDFDGYDSLPAVYAMKFLAENVAETEAELPDAVYKLIVRKMYGNIVRILLDQKYPKGRRTTQSEELQKLIDWCFEEAYEGNVSDWLSFPIHTDLPLVGVGAPIHVFLPRVASLLGTRAIIHPDAPVANAVGAIASEIISREELHVKAEYSQAVLVGYSVYDGDSRLMFKRYEEAEKKAVSLAKEKVRKKALLQGSSREPEIQVEIHKIHSRFGRSEMFFESIVEAVATDLFHDPEQ